MKRVIFVEPSSRASTVFSPFVRQWPLTGPIILGTILHERGHDVKIYNENILGPITENSESMNTRLTCAPRAPLSTSSAVAAGKSTSKSAPLLKRSVLSYRTQVCCLKAPLVSA